jgi:hypothetical protein
MSCNGARSLPALGSRVVGHARSRSQGQLWSKWRGWWGACTVCLAVSIGCGVKELPRASVGAPLGGAPDNPTGAPPAPATSGASGAAGAGATGGAPGNAGGAGGATSSNRGGMAGSMATGGTGGSMGSTDAAAPAPAGPGVTIAGKAVERGNAIVFLHIGHSNMAGRASGPAELLPYFTTTDPRLWAYAVGGQFRPAKEPLAPDMDTGMHAGPGMALLRSALMTASADSYFISIGHGHSGTYGGNCANFRKGGLFYDIVMKPALELKGRVTYGGIFSMLGQSEHSQTSARQQGFADCMAGIAGDMRADLGEPELPFMVGDYEQGISRSDIAPGSAFGKLLIAQMAMIPGKVARSALIPTDGLPMEDDHHFNMAGHKAWAERAIEIMKTRGWMAWQQ